MKPRVFTAAVVISLLLMGPAVYAQSGDCEQVSRTWSSVKNAIPMTLPDNYLAPSCTSVYELRVDFSKTIVNPTITLESTDADKSDLSVIPGGSLYEYFIIGGNKLPASNMDSLRIKFFVPKSWADENNVNHDQVSLLTMSDSQIWSELNVDLIGETSDRFQYQTDISGLDLPNLDGNEVVFAVVGESEVQEPVTPEPTLISENGDAVEQEPQASKPVEVTQEEFERSEQEKSQEGIVTIIIVVAIVAAVAALFLMPGSFIRKSAAQRK